MASTDGELKPQSFLSPEKQHPQQKPVDMRGAKQGIGFLSLPLDSAGAMSVKASLWGETISQSFDSICDCQDSSLAWRGPMSLTAGG